MMLITGQRMCGRVDEVPGTCYVATRFLHLYYVPLIPLSSWVIVRGTESSSGFQGQQIRLSSKSVVFGWLQAFLIIFGLMNSIHGVILLANPQKIANAATEGAAALILGLTSLIVWLLFMIRPLRASNKRRHELLKKLGLNSEADEEHVDDIEIISDPEKEPAWTEYR